MTAKKKATATRRKSRPKLPDLVPRKNPKSGASSTSFVVSNLKTIIPCVKIGIPET